MTPPRPSRAAIDAALSVLRDEMLVARNWHRKHLIGGLSKSAERYANRADRLAEVIAWMEGQDG